MRASEVPEDLLMESRAFTLRNPRRTYSRGLCQEQQLKERKAKTRERSKPCSHGSNFLFRLSWLNSDDVSQWQRDLPLFVRPVSERSPHSL